MQKKWTLGLSIAGLLVLLLLYANVAPAQAVSGTLLGTVQDSTRAVVPNANVTLTNEGTNVSNKTTTGPQGFYTFPNLNPGNYSITVEANGFKKLVSAHNIVLVQQATRVDMTLTPGMVTAEVTVTGSTMPLVESTTSDLGFVLDTTQMNTLPINGRMEALVLQLAPGTTPAAWGSGNAEDSATAATTAPGSGMGAYTTANGFPHQGNLYLVDGVTNQELQNAYQGLQIPLAFISEMKVETNNPTAEYGTYGGLVSNLTTKTGTNKFHGQVFEFNRNTDFNAHDYWSHLNPPFHQNQFGAEVDGPIFKNKLFFSGDFQWLKQAQGSSAIKSLPTANARSGNLSGFVDSHGTGPITNPMACYYSALANGLPNPVPCTASPAVTVAGTYDTVPAADIVPIAGAAHGYLQPSIWPLPNLPGELNNATIVQMIDASFPQEDVRVDYAFSQSDRFFARMSYGNRTINQPLLVAGSSTPNPYMNNQNNSATNMTTNDVIAWDHMFGKKGTMINQLRLGFSRFATSQYVMDYGISANNNVGVPNGNIAAWPDTSGIAQVAIGFFGTGDNGTLPAGLGRLSNYYQLNDAFTLIHGRHNLKFGGYLEPIQARVANPQLDPRGQLSTSGNYTGGGSTGAQIADWLVGSLSAVNRDHLFDNPNTRTTFFGFFVQDDLRLSSHLSLNLGIRYDIYTMPVDKYNLQSNFVRSGTGAGQIQIASSTNRGPNTTTPYDEVSPRLGFAYSPDNGKTAIRGAFGVAYFNDVNGGWGGTLERNYPEMLIQKNSPAQSNCNSLYTGTGVWTTPGQYTEYSQCGSLVLSNGLPGKATSGAGPGYTSTGAPVYSALVQPAGMTPGGFVTPPNGFGVYQIGSNSRQDQGFSWNVNVQRQLGPIMTIHAAYVGTAGTHMFHDYQLNQCNPTSFTQGPTYAQLQTQYGTTVYPSYPQCLPYYGVAPGVTTVDYRYSSGKVHYNAGEFEFQRRQGNNLVFTLDYTYSKSMDNIQSPLSGYWTKEEQTTQGFRQTNYPRSLSSSYVYRLPIGRGQKFFNSISTVVDEIVGGWTFSGVTFYHSGAPLLVSASTTYLLSQNGGQRANYNCGSALNPHSLTQWFDTSCFSQPYGFVFGNGGTAQGHNYGPHYLDFDWSARKAIHITERAQLEFEANFFNVFNHTNFTNPNTSCSATNAGAGNFACNTTSNFGKITGDFLPRQGQLGMTLSF